MLKYKLFLIPLMLVITACGTLGLEKAESFEDRVAYAGASLTAVLGTATRALELGDISVDEAQVVANTAEEMLRLIDVAQVVKAAGDAAGAEASLAMAVRILEELQVYLRSRQA